MKLLSVNVSQGKTVADDGKTVETGIFKEPVEGSVTVRTLNLDGDRQADREFHGGACKAVYAYPFEHYDFWERDLGRTDFGYGQFGENLTVEGLLEDDVCVGDLLRVGTSIFELTQPRVPCFKLGIRMGGLRDFPNRFLKSGRVGFYLRVVEEGAIQAGDTVEHVRVDPDGMTIRELHHAMHFDRRNVEAARKALGLAALSPGWCRGFERRLAAAGVPFEPRRHPLDSQCCAGL